MGRHPVDATIAKAFAPLVQVDLVIVDHIGLQPCPPTQADAANGRRSLAVSTNLRPSAFDQLM